MLLICLVLAHTIFSVNPLPPEFTDRHHCMNKLTHHLLDCHPEIHWSACSSNFCMFSKLKSVIKSCPFIMQTSHNASASCQPKHVAHLPSCSPLTGTRERRKTSSQPRSELYCSDLLVATSPASSLKAQAALKQYQDQQPTVGLFYCL